MPAKHVRPYSKGQKSNFRDREAIAEAVRRPTMFLPRRKSARSARIASRARAVGQICAFLLKRGITVR